MGYFLKSMRWQDYPLAGDEQKSDFFEVYPPMVFIIGRMAVAADRYGGGAKTERSCLFRAFFERKGMNAAQALYEK